MVPFRCWAYFSIIKYIARQINVNPNSFSLYAQREPTKHEHMEEIRQVYSYQNFSLGNYRKVSQFLLNHALQNGKSMYLLRTAQEEELRNQKIILPGITTTCTLSKWQKQKLDKLIDPFVDNRKTPLAWLRELPGQSSPEAFLKVIKRLEYIRDLKLEINTEQVHPNRLLNYLELEHGMHHTHFEDTCLNQSTKGRGKSSSHSCSHGNGH
ncbi:DUF4158 domain-containing protein [Bacillus altitudinis]